MRSKKSSNTYGKSFFRPFNSRMKEIMPVEITMRFMKGLKSCHQARNTHRICRTPRTPVDFVWGGTHCIEETIAIGIPSMHPECATAAKTYDKQPDTILIRFQWRNPQQKQIDLLIISCLITERHTMIETSASTAFPPLCIISTFPLSEQEPRSDTRKPWTAT